MAGSLDTTDLVVRLSERGARAAAAQALAAHLGAEAFLLFVRDPQLGALIPAPGFAQTLHGGPAWRAFLARCTASGRYAGEVDLPRESRRPALALVAEGMAAVIIGGQPAESGISVLQLLLPMLSVALGAEQLALIADAESVEARTAASRAHALANALEAARADAARLNAQLQEEHRHKDDFLAMLAHELRNPLTPLVMSIELLRRRPAGPDATVQHLDIMTRQIRQLTRLVDDLLDVSRVSRGRIELRRQPVQLSEVLAHSLEASRPILDARRHDVRVSLAQEALAVRADSARLTQVFANLLHNAAKYTDPGGRIDISAERDGDHAVVRVADNGMGISAEMLPRVFELFTQAPVSLARAQGGLGIGLKLVRALVELHGGRVEAESRGLGHGSTFRVRLPLSGYGQPPANGLAGAAGASASNGRPLRVLVIDDNEDSADVLAALLRAWGHHVEVAYSGLGAAQIASDLDADLVFLDLGLPGLDGFEVGRRLHRVMRPDARFIALTGYGSEADKRRSREAGFDEHVVKPVPPEALQAILERAAKAAKPAKD